MSTREWRFDQHAFTCTFAVTTGDLLEMDILIVGLDDTLTAVAGVENNSPNTKAATKNFEHKEILRSILLSPCEVIFGNFSMAKVQSLGNSFDISVPIRYRKLGFPNASIRSANLRRARMQVVFYVDLSRASRCPCGDRYWKLTAPMQLRRMLNTRASFATLEVAHAFTSTRLLTRAAK